MNIRFGSIICLVFSVLAFRAQGLDFERFNIIQKIGEYIDYMLGEDPVRYVRYFYVYVICRFLKGKLSNQTLPLSPTLFWAYLNGSLVFYHAELAARLPLERQENKVMGFSLESALDYSYWIYWWAVASQSSMAHALIAFLPGTILFENYDLYGLVAGILSNDHRTRSIY
jgi:hypothetical protein